MAQLGDPSCATNSTRLIQLLGLAVYQCRPGRCSSHLAERLPSGKSGSSGIQPHTTSRCSGPAQCLQQERPSLTALRLFFHTTPFWGENSAGLPSSNFLSSTQNPLRSKTSPVPWSCFGASAPEKRGWNKQEAREEGMLCRRTDMLFSSSQRWRCSQGLGGDDSQGN